MMYCRDLWPRHLIDIRGHANLPQPAAVVWPKNTDELAMLTEVAGRQGVPLAPLGAGSGVCGGILPDSRWWVVDLKEMSDWHITDDGILDAAPGVLGITLEEELQRRGYTTGPFPSSILCSTVGGWVAARGAGQCSGRYGKIEDMVVGLECVTGDGHRMLARRRKSGPDLVPLLVGSEGTLGFLSRVQLRLARAPTRRSFLAFSFAGVDRGWDTMRLVFQAGLRPAVARLYDPLDSMMLKQGKVERGESDGQAKTKQSPSSPRKWQGGKAIRSALMKAVLRSPRATNAAIGLTEIAMRGASTLVFIFEGEDEGPADDAEAARRLCVGLGGKDLGEGPARAWMDHRYSVSYRQAPIFRMGAFSDTMEVASTWSKLDGLYENVRKALSPHVIVMAHLSHAYPDGCSIYFTFAGSAKDDAGARDLYDRAWRDGLSAVLASGATLSHHHGIGRSKAPRLGEEIGEGVGLVEKLMGAWDPSRIMNPGNLVPTKESERSGAGASPAPTIPTPEAVDEHSLLATFDGGTRVADAERTLRERGLTLALDGSPSDATVGAWIGQGMPGASNRWLDPVDQHIAGFSARLKTGADLVVRPSPRRAVGPDLSALFHGTSGAIGDVTSATLRIRRASTSAARELPFAGERDPSLSEGERVAWQRAIDALTKP